MDELEYKIRQDLASIYESKINNIYDKYINDHKNDIRYFIHYPLVDMEFSINSGDPADIKNQLKRLSYGLLVSKTHYIWEKMNYKTNILANGYGAYKNQYQNRIVKAWRYNDFYKSIKDGNSYAKSIITRIDDNRFRYTSSIVSNKYREDNFYYYGFDDKDNHNSENSIIQQNLVKFTLKYFMCPHEIKKLLKNIDVEMMDYCRQKVSFDISKMHKKTKSDVFNKLDDLLNVLTYLYYIAFVTKLNYCIHMEYGFPVPYNDILISYNKNLLINEIACYYGIEQIIVSKIINYLINDGKNNILEFPFFSHKEMIYTIPSLIMINDWSFTIINGHYIKGIKFWQREKTISVSTEIKLENKLKNVSNIIYGKEKNYSIIDSEGIKIDSDIDFAILDTDNKVVLVIETKWKDNHYIDGEINHIKVQDTLFKIFGKQISKHKEYLKSNDNFLSLFDNHTTLSINDVEIFYLAIDKRNQLHLNNNHMITEYMLMWLIDSNTNNNILDLKAVINLIKDLNTETTYVFSPPIHEMPVLGEYIVEFDDVDYID